MELKNSANNDSPSLKISNEILAIENIINVDKIVEPIKPDVDWRRYIYFLVKKIWFFLIEIRKILNFFHKPIKKNKVFTETFWQTELQNDYHNNG